MIQLTHTLRHLVGTAGLKTEVLQPQVGGLNSRLRDLAARSRFLPVTLFKDFGIEVEIVDAERSALVNQSN